MKSSGSKNARVVPSRYGVCRGTGLERVLHLARGGQGQALCGHRWTVHVPALLLDQGDADVFLAEQLKTRLLGEACERARMPATIRMQPGYHHSYYFISTFLADHVGWHAVRL